MAEKKNYFKMFTDILKEGDKYSQGRVYLLWSIFAYYITLGILMWSGIMHRGVNNDGIDVGIDIEKFKMIVDALEYAMTLFGGYVFGGKFIDAYKAVKGSKSPNEDMG